MKEPLHIVFRGFEHSDAVEADVRRHAEKLEQFYGDITSCRVVVERGQGRHRKGNLYHVRVDLRLPGVELVAGREPAEHHAHEDVYVAIRDSFAALQRRLEDFARRERGKVKQHEMPSHGRIAELFPEMDYGRIETARGRSVYFHRNSVLDGDFDHLELGARVRFVEEMGEQGPKATTVHVEGKHHAVG